MKLRDNWKCLVNASNSPLPFKVHLKWSVITLMREIPLRCNQINTSGLVLQVFHWKPGWALASAVMLSIDFGILLVCLFVYIVPPLSVSSHALSLQIWEWLTVNLLSQNAGLASLPYTIASPQNLVLKYQGQHLRPDSSQLQYFSSVKATVVDMITNTSPCIF